MTLCPTRYREHNEPSVLNLVLTNSDIIEDLEYLSPIGKSDHVLLGFTCTIESELLQNATKFNYIPKETTMTLGTIWTETGPMNYLYLVMT